MRAFEVPVVDIAPYTADDVELWLSEADRVARATTRMFDDALGQLPDVPTTIGAHIAAKLRGSRELVNNTADTGREAGRVLASSG